MIKVFEIPTGKVLYVPENIWNYKEQCAVTLCYHKFWCYEKDSFESGEGFVCNRGDLKEFDKKK